MCSSDTQSTRLRAMAAGIRAGIYPTPEALEREALFSARMERTLDEIAANALEDADNAVRQARLGNVVQLRPRARLLGAPAWFGPDADGVA